MTEATQATPEISPHFASEREAVILRKYCEKGWPIGKPTERMHAVTGETYTELTRPWSEGFETAAKAREAAQEHFDKYAVGKQGALYWRIAPEIAYGSKQKLFSYYMRLLISDKPHAKVST